MAAKLWSVPKCFMAWIFYNLGCKPINVEDLLVQCFRQWNIFHHASWRDWDSISKCSVGQHWFGGLRWFGWTSSKILHGSATFYHDSAGDFNGSLQWICFLLFWICSWTLGFVLPLTPLCCPLALRFPPNLLRALLPNFKQELQVPHTARWSQQQHDAQNLAHSISVNT